jgi:hypothetical protein
MSDAPETRPSRGLARDFHTARQGAKASADELRQYVAQFRGKSPQEMLGLVAASNLVQATVLATVVTVVFLAAFTVGPYLWNKMSSPVAKAPPKAAAPAETPTASAPAPQTATPVAAGTAAPPMPAATAVAPNDPVLERLGIGEVKMADPKAKNPLDAGADDLLKDIK